MTLSTTKCAMTSDLVSNKPIFWFAAYTKPRQEKFIRDRLTEMDIENFIPTKFEEHQWKYRKKIVEVPLIPRLVFIHTDFEKSFSLLNDYNFQIKFMKDNETKTLLIIPNKQMNDFMLVIESKEHKTEILMTDFIQGDKVRVIKGPLQGVEGRLENKKNKNKVVISVQGIISIAINISVDCLEKID